MRQSGIDLFGRFKKASGALDALVKRGLKTINAEQKSAFTFEDALSFVGSEELIKA